MEPDAPIRSGTHALGGLGYPAWKLTSGPGAAPVDVPGWTRLAIKLAILGPGAAAMILAGRRDIGLAYAAVIVFHYAVSWINPTHRCCPLLEWCSGCSPLEEGPA